MQIPIPNFSISLRHFHTPILNHALDCISLPSSISTHSLMEGSLSSSSFLSSPPALAILMILIIIILILIACKFKPWHRFLTPSPTLRRSPQPIKDEDDIERPLVSGELGVPERQIINVSSSSNSTEQGDLNSLNSVPKQRPPPTSPQLSHSDSYILNITNSSEETSINKTLKSPITASQFSPGEWIHEKKDDNNYGRKHSADKDFLKDIVPTHSASQGCTLVLEVISGPCHGLRHSIESSDKLPVTIGRVPPADMTIKDSEVSGKHAMINWNINKSKWELVDMGSLNGTVLNSRAINLSQSGTRHWSNPVELSNGDVITLGTTSKLLIHIITQIEHSVPFGIGVASDPMAVRRGGKKLPMEDVCYYHWPLPGVDKFGVFGICDGHGGADAATSVSKIMPEVIISVLSDSSRREKVLSQCNASDVLKEAFYETEAQISHYYEGCTATVLLVWLDDHENCFLQCANVGDSACVVNIGGRQVKLTEDHRIVSYSERLRFQALGMPLGDGETRICGINLARMLGDKFLKEQDTRFSSEPYISDVITIDRSSKGFAIMASDGFWDVVNTKKAAQLVHQTMEKNAFENSALKIAKVLLNEARTLRTKDNTSIIFLDFTSR